MYGAPHSRSSDEESSTNHELAFSRQVAHSLEPHSEALIDALKKLVNHDYPTKVASLDFLVFPDRFTCSFPVRAFFMDANDSEVYVFEDGEARYPSPIDPGILRLDRVYGDDLSEQLLTTAPGVSHSALAAKALIPWFTRCWEVAGGLQFDRRATIQIQGDSHAHVLAQHSRQPDSKSIETLQPKKASDQIILEGFRPKHIDPPSVALLLGLPAGSATAAYLAARGSLSGIDMVNWVFWGGYFGFWIAFAVNYFEYREKLDARERVFHSRCAKYMFVSTFLGLVVGGIIGMLLVAALLGRLKPRVLRTDKGDMDEAS